MPGNFTSLPHQSDEGAETNRTFIVMNTTLESPRLTRHCGEVEYRGIVDGFVNVR